MAKKKFLWIGDAVCDSGFARATHYTVDRIRLVGNVEVLGINYRGDPHDYPYKIYPAWPGGDLHGVGRLEQIVPIVDPDVIVIQNDPWNIPFYTETLRVGSPKIKLVGMLAVDGANCRGGKKNALTVEGLPDYKKQGLNQLDLAMFWTQFGAEQARRGGYQGRTAVVPLGVDLNIYAPMDREEARTKIGLPLPPGAFLVGNVNRNQPRKRMDLTLQYFAEWLHQFPNKDAFLFLHVAPTGESAYDLNQLSEYFGLRGRVILSNPQAYHGLKEAQLSMLYSCFDVGISTTQGEGWGLPAMEMMACGVPQILPDWSAYGEWAKGAASLIPCTSNAVTFNEINVIGGVPDKQDFIDTLQEHYEDLDVRAHHSAEGLKLVAQPQYRWEHIGDTVAATILNEFGW